MRFFGNGICCASYACLNAMQDPSIDLQLFEISLSTPFGIRHYENGLFDRLLTTYCDPNKGLDRALRIWGYRVQTHRIATPEEAVVCIRSLIQPGNPVLIGPIDMGALGYQIMPSMLRRMDHYLVLEFYTDNQVLCTDSEGFLQYPLEDAQLCRYLNAEQVLEAEGCITVRQIEKEYQYNMEEILRFALKFAADNLQAAEESEEGSHAINKCCE